jgi:hypothetical protein
MNDLNKELPWKKKANDRMKIAGLAPAADAWATKRCNEILQHGERVQLLSLLKEAYMEGAQQLQQAIEQEVQRKMRNGNLGDLR